ncbi:MAG: hypothetical protein AB1649_09190 [Chloroflexota bacterium]
MENLTMDIILQSIGFLLLPVILVLYWLKAFRQAESRLFWGLLAMAWTFNLLGNIAWIVHDLVTGTALETLSAIDLLYILRYVLVGAALWLYPAPLPSRAWSWIVGAMLAASAVVWAVYFDPAMEISGGNWTGFLGLALYPVLDVGIVAIAWLRVRATRQSVWGKYVLLLFYSMASYGIANTVNLTEYVFSSIFGGVLQNVLWILADVFLLVIVLRADLRQEKPAEE